MSNLCFCPPDNSKGILSLNLFNPNSSNRLLILSFSTPSFPKRISLKTDSVKN